MKLLINPLTHKPITQLEFNLKNTLVNGQAFNWVNRDQNTNKDFRGILGKNVIDFQVNDKNEILYKETPKNAQIEDILKDYLQLNTDLEKLCKEWSEKDSHYAAVYEQLKGVRILRQFPFECMISFICSQNNNIPRITQILKKLRKTYGEEIHREKIEGQEEEEIYYSFPTVQSLRKASEQDLKDLGLGYRAGYITSTVELLESKGGDKFLSGLRDLKSSHKKREALLEFKGIGNKVADCISLFSLDAKDLIPVDTHVFQIYNRVFKKNKNKDKKVTKESYSEVENFFKSIYGDYAGWAQQAIFAAELSQFSDEMASSSQQSTSGAKKTKSSNGNNKKTMNTQDSDEDEDDSEEEEEKSKQANKRNKKQKKQ